MAKRRHSDEWGEITRLIRASLHGQPGFGTKPVTVGRLSAIADGINHDNYAFVANGQPLLLRLSKVGPVFPPEETRESITREAETLQRLDRCPFPYRAPKLIRPVTDENGQAIGMIETCLEGAPLSYLKTGVHGKSRLEVIGEIAARVHQLPVSEFSHLAPCADSETHVRAELDLLPPDLIEFPVVAATRDWILAHLTHRPAVVLHGDLQPQNVLWDMMGSGDVSVVDWEYTRLGDPAYDLAIVTRGERQPLKESGGFQKLLSTYETATGQALPASAIRIHEMLMILGWLAEAAQDRAERRMRGQGPDYFAAQLTGVLRRSASSE